MGWLVLIWRLPRTGYILGRAGILAEMARSGLFPDWVARLFFFINFAIASKRSRINRGEALCTALQQLGPGFVKFGQALATRADLIGPEMAKALTNLQDNMPAFPAKHAHNIIESHTGKTLDALFLSFDDRPVAAASIAQVHKAVMPDGRAVAVKILRPHIHRDMRKDIHFFRSMARLAEAIAPAMRRLRLKKAVDQFAQISEMELDLRFEAAAAGRMAEQLADDEGIRIPYIDLELSHHDMLVIEWIDGVRIDDVDALISAGHNIDQITEIAATSFFNQVFRDGYFHGDMHPGNIFVTKDGTLVPIDFGIMGHLQFRDRLFLARLLNALLERDYDRVASLHADAGMLPPSIDIALFSQHLRALADPVLGKALGEISLGMVLGQILQISSRFQIEVQPQFNLLQKTMIMAEGVARSLNPKADMWHLAEPLATSWLASEAGLARQAELVSQDILAVITKLPDIIDRLADGQSDPPVRKSAGWMQFTAGLGLGIAAGCAGAIALMTYFL
jgi:ubiquinone biosynthesis protein